MDFFPHLPDLLDHGELEFPNGYNQGVSGFPSEKKKTWSWITIL